MPTQANATGLGSGSHRPMQGQAGESSGVADARASSAQKGEKEKGEQMTAKEKEA